MKLLLHLNCYRRVNGRENKAGLSSAVINASTSTALWWKAEDLYGTLSNTLSPDLTSGPFALGATRTDEAQSAIQIIRNQTPDFAVRRKWKRKASIHCLVIKSHFISPPLVPCASFPAIGRLLSAKWAQLDSKCMRHTYLTFTAEGKASKQDSNQIVQQGFPLAIHYSFNFLFVCNKACVCLFVLLLI